MLRCSPTVTLSAAPFILVAMFLISMGLASHAQVHQGNPPARTRTVPTLESLPHEPLPRGKFKGWCGQKDRYLLAVNGQFEAYDAGVKYATIAVSSDWPWQCSSDGERLVYIDTRMGYVTRVDIASGDSRLLASYQPPERENTVISFSPDLQSVATTAPLKLSAEAGKLNVISVQHIRHPEESVQLIRWSKDSSAFAVGYESTTVQIIDVGGKRVGLGQRPKAGNVDDGWLDIDRKALTLFLVPEQESTGIVVSCDLGPWKCRRLQSSADSFSSGGRGIMGMVKPPNEAAKYYAAEVRHQVFGLLARQVYDTFSDRLEYAMSVSPSGTRAVLTWTNLRLAGCGYGPDSVKCIEGILINLSKVHK